MPRGSIDEQIDFSFAALLLPIVRDSVVVFLAVDRFIYLLRSIFRFMVPNLQYRQSFSLSRHFTLPV